MHRPDSVTGMSAIDHQGYSPGNGRRSLAPGASPRAVADALLPEDRQRFLGEYDRLWVEARTSLDLAPVYDLVERWRGVAALQLDPERYRRSLRRAAERITGETSPDDEPLEITRAKASR